MVGTPGYPGRLVYWDGNNEEWYVLKMLTIQKPQGLLLAVCWFLAAVLILLALGIKVSFSNFQLIQTEDTRLPIDIPFSGESPRDPATYVLEGELRLGFLAPGRFRIIPDDRLVAMNINGRDVDLSVVPPDKAEDFVNGFSLDLGSYLKGGVNTIQAHLWDRGGPGLYGIDIHKAGLDWRVLLAMAAVLLVLPGLARVYDLSKVTPLQWVLYAIIVAGNLLQIWVIVEYNPVDHVWSDPGRHWEQGVEPLRIDLMSMSDPIMYQLYIGALAKLTLNMPALVTFYTSLLALAGHWIWYRFFRELQTSKTLALAGWAVVSLLPSWSSIYSYFMQETLLLPLLGASLWATWRARRKGDLRSFLLMVALWVAAGLTRGTAIPLAAVCCTWLWLQQDLKIQKAVFSTLILVLVLGPLTYRSYQTVHHFAPHGMGHLAAIYGMSGKREIVLHTTKDGSRWTHIFGSPSTGATPFKPLSDWKTARTGKVIVNADLNKGSEDWDKAYEDVALTWEKYFWITGEGLAFLFFAPSWPDSNPERLIDVININMRWIWAPALLVAIVGLIVMRRKLRGTMLLPSLILAWFIVQGLIPISVAEGRYRKPFEGLIISQYILFAAAAVGAIRKVPYSHPDPVWSRFRRRKNSDTAEVEGESVDVEGDPVEVRGDPLTVEGGATDGDTASSTESTEEPCRATT